jgi:hypothetical protein
MVASPENRSRSECQRGKFTSARRLGENIKERAIDGAHPFESAEAVTAEAVFLGEATTPSV